MRVCGALDTVRLGMQRAGSRGQCTLKGAARIQVGVFVHLAGKQMDPFWIFNP